MPSQNTYEEYFTTSLTMSSKSLGNPCRFKLIFKYFLSVLTSNSTTSPLGPNGSFACLKYLTYAINTHYITLFRSSDNYVYLYLNISVRMYNLLPVHMIPLSLVSPLMPMLLISHIHLLAILQLISVYFEKGKQSPLKGTCTLSTGVLLLDVEMFVLVKD